MLKKIMLATAALCLTACGGEKYPVPATEAYATLSSVGTPTGVSPLPAAFSGVSVSFDSLPSDSQVRWRFSHNGSDIGAIVAKVDPSGDKASVVSLSYVDGTAPDGEWNNKQVRTMIKTGMKPLIAEAIDSRFDGRPFDMELYRQINLTLVQTNIGGMMKDASSAMDEAVAKQKEERAQSAARGNNPYDATKPSVDLSKTN
jgi:hypothetical protein